MPYRPSDALGTEGASTLAESAEAVQDAGPHILVAEDDEMVRELTVQILSACGYQVLEAADGEEALALLDQYAQTLQLAVLDLVMPKHSGKGVYERLREQGLRLPVLFTSGYSQAELEGLRPGEDGVEVIKKPYLPNELRCQVAALLAQA